MADGELKVVVKAKELATHTFKLTSNCNRYPKKYRHSLVDRMQVKSLEIHDTLLEANRINNVTHKQKRCEKITEAITPRVRAIFCFRGLVVAQMARAEK